MTNVAVEPDAPGVVAPDDEAPPRIAISRRHGLALGLFVIAAVVLLYFGLPQLGGVKDSWQRLDDGEPWWLVAAIVFKAISFVGYMWLFQTVCLRGRTRIGWRESYQISMAGLAATRLFATAGAGGIALTAWALRRSGMEPRLVACRMVAFNVLLYTVYAGALLVGGVGLYVGLFAGPAPFAITIVPAIVMAIAFALVFSIALVPEDIERRLAGRVAQRGPVRRFFARLAAAPASVAAGVRTALRILRRGEAGALGAVVWWAFDIATLWAAFHAFAAETPAIAVLVVAYFVGMLGNLLPLPAGIGGVDGGMIGAFVAFGVDFGLATVAVLTYRAFAFWLPTLPGAIAYLQLRRTVAGWRDERSEGQTAAAMA